MKKFAHSFTGNADTPKRSTPRSALRVASTARINVPSPKTATPAPAKNASARSTPLSAKAPKTPLPSAVVESIEAPSTLSIPSEMANEVNDLAMKDDEVVDTTDLDARETNDMLNLEDALDHFGSINCESEEINEAENLICLDDGTDMKRVAAELTLGAVNVESLGTSEETQQESIENLQPSMEDPEVSEALDMNLEDFDISKVTNEAGMTEQKAVTSTPATSVRSKANSSSKLGSRVATPVVDSFSSTLQITANIKSTAKSTKTPPARTPGPVSVNGKTPAQSSRSSTPAVTVKTPSARPTVAAKRAVILGLSTTTPTAPQSAMRPKNKSTINSTLVNVQRSAPVIRTVSSALPETAASPAKTVKTPSKREMTESVPGSLATSSKKPKMSDSESPVLVSSTPTTLPTAIVNADMPTTEVKITASLTPGAFAAPDAVESVSSAVKIPTSTRKGVTFGPPVCSFPPVLFF